MGVFSEGFTCKVGDSDASSETFAVLALLEVPEIFSGAKSKFPNRTTADTGGTKRYGIGIEEGDEMTLTTERDFSSATQDLLRTAYGAGAEINLQFIITDGTIAETNGAGFKVTSIPVVTADPNGDGETTKQMFNIFRNTDWSTAEA